ncbi:MAG: FkbM family methyltransferase [Gammaproteobacteria bacterium]|nr:FkbM family methyltransferase [Gammaproteobacteria bacterium]NNL99766.1 FkbM family methyltransferase [Gammaproteobacteria bacterium]
MSRGIAAFLDRCVSAVTAIQSPRQRMKTLARLREHIDRKGLVEIETPRGTLRFLGLRGPNPASMLARFHDDEPETLEWIDTYIKPGDTVWDIGANIGAYALYAGTIENVTVYAFEPGALNFGLMVEHLQLNRLGDRVLPICAAFADETGIEALQIGEFSAGHTSALGDARNQFDAFDAAFAQSVPVYTIDGFRRTFSLPPPDHIKLDVDGIEGAIIAGAAETLPQVKTLTVEVEGDNVTHAGERIDAPLLAAGFEEQPEHRGKGYGRNRLYVRPG